MKNVVSDKSTAPRFGLKRQAAVAGVLLAAGLAAATGLAFGFQRTLYSAARQAAEVDIPETMLAHRLALQAARCYAAQAEFEAVAAAPESRREAVQLWHQAYRELEGVLKASPPGVSGATRSKIAEWTKLGEKYRQSFLSGVAAAQGGQTVPADVLHQALGDSRAAVLALLTQAEQWAAEQADECKAAGLELQQLAGSQIRLMALRCTVVLLIFVAASLWLSRTILQRIAVLSTAVCRFAAGNHTTRIACHTDDELGMLARQFNEMASTIQRNQEELKRARDAAQTENLAKSEFLAALGGKISEPIQVIRDYACTMLGELEDPDNRHAAVTIRRTSDYLLDVARSVLDLSKIELDRLHVERVPCSPGEVVAEVCSQMRPQAEGKGLSLDVHYRSPLPETVQTDPVRLRQILVHLLDDAIREAESGTLRLAIGLIRCGNQGQLRFEVSAAGPPAFPRMPAVAGLGLVIARRLAHLLGGTVDGGGPGQSGGEIAVTVPTGSLCGVRMLDSHSESVPAGESEAAAGEPKFALDCRVLLAEDGPENQRLITFILKRAGAEVEVVSNGRDVLERVLPNMDGSHGLSPARPYDAILMDIDMPVMDGCEATSRLRQSGYRGLVIAVTGHGLRYDRDKCLKTGFDDYLAKPIDRQALLQMLARHAVLAEPAGLAGCSR